MFTTTFSLDELLDLQDPDFGVKISQIILDATLDRLREADPNYLELFRMDSGHAIEQTITITIPKILTYRPDLATTSSTSEEFGLLVSIRPVPPQEESQ